LLQKLGAWRMKDKEIREFIIKVASIGGTFLGEHGMIHEPSLELLVEEFKYWEKYRKEHGLSNEK